MLIFNCDVQLLMSSYESRQVENKHKFSKEQDGKRAGRTTNCLELLLL
jgi:hypothetical protein